MIFSWLEKSSPQKWFFILILSCLSLRLIPYFFPIRAQDILQKEQAIEFKDRRGLPLGILLTRDQENTAIVSLNQVSPYFIQGIIATEDARFYHHGALDLWAIGRAILEAIQARKFVSGASTISMQLARMLKNPEGNLLTIKLQEIWIAWRLFAGMNHQEILHAYINRLPMGGNLYGIEAGSRRYFGVSSRHLNLAQASLLVSIPNDPNHLNPYRNWSALKKRQRYVLNRMVREKYITQKQANQAFLEEVSLLEKPEGIIAAPHFLFWLASQLPPDHPAQIITTIDRSLQQFVEAQVKQVIESLAEHNVQDGAVLVIHNPTGEILAYVGSPNYFNEVKNGRNDGVQALRQPGSTLKPFLYQLALAKNLIKTQTILADVPTYYAIPGARLYNPTNYHEETFLGPVRVRIALANSLNVPAVKLLEKMGVDTFLNRLQELGFTHLDQTPEYYGLGLTLGSGEVSLWELGKAYTILAQSGKIKPLISHFNSSSLPVNQENLTQIDTPTFWQFITSVLSDPYARSQAFGVDSVLSLPFPTAVKTGTSSDFRDTWTVGFTKDYTVATWVGNFNGEPMKKVSGVMGAAPLWNRIMLHLHEQHNPPTFDPPQGLIKRSICAISGSVSLTNCSRIVQEYLDPNDSMIAHQNNLLFHQSPEYKKWLSYQDGTELTSRNLQIISPENNDYFLLTSQENSSLQFKITGGTQKQVEWWLNDEKISQTDQRILSWKMKPGKWTLQVKSGQEIDRVSFEVELRENRLLKRGFSFGGNP